MWKNKDKNVIDKETFIELVKDNKSSLYKIAYMYVKNERDAIDIFDEAVYKAYLSLHKLKKPEFFKSWFTRIIINTALDFLRKQKRIIYIDDYSSFDKDLMKDSIEDSLLNNFDLYKAIDSLKGELKTVIILKYFEGYTIKEISEILNLSESNVKNRLHKSLCILREKVEGGIISGQIRKYKNSR